MTAATIVFTDIVGFSKKTTQDQRKLIESLTSEVVYILRSLMNPPHDNPSVVALPTGDGMALGFLHQVQRPWDDNTIFGLILKLHKWAFDQSKLSVKQSDEEKPDEKKPIDAEEKQSVTLRVGVHVGAVELITDINGSTNICGHTINHTQRVMDAADGRQTLFSDIAFSVYVGEKDHQLTLPALSSMDADLKAKFDGPYEVFVKHDLRIPIYQMKIFGEAPYHSSQKLKLKDMVLLDSSSLPKKVDGEFSKRLAAAKNIAFIQYTGERFIDEYEKGNITFSPDLKSFWVFMPDPAIYANLKLTKKQATAEDVSNAVEKWRILLSKLKTDHSQVEFKLGLFKEPPYLGASFLDWNRPEGKIHVSPCVWNVEATRCPGYDLKWIGQGPSDIYEAYVDGLNYLHRTTKNELD